MNLLNPNQRSSIFKAIQDVTDTFAKQVPVQVVRRTRGAGFFSDSPASTVPVTFSILAMNVPDKRTVEQEQQGASDRTGGYVLVNVADMVAAGLAGADGLLLLNEATDTISINGGPELRLDKVVSLGPLSNTFAVAKLMYSQELAKN